MTDASSAVEQATVDSAARAANVVSFETIEHVSRMIKGLDLPVTHNWPTTLVPNSLAADLIRAAGPAAQLSKALAGFALMSAAADLSRMVKGLGFAATHNSSTTLAHQLLAADLIRAAGINRELSQPLAGSLPYRHALVAIAAASVSGPGSPFAAQMGQIFSSQYSIMRLMMRVDVQLKETGLFATLGRYSHVQAQLGALTTAPDATILLRGLSRAPGRRYDAYLDGLPARPIARRAAVAEAAGDTQSGLLIAESLTADGLSDDDRQSLAETLTIVTLEPWQTGPSDARSDLFAALAELDPELPDWLKAAWDDIVRDGPKSASKIANCAVECIDQTLRAIASVEDVAAWIAQTGTRAGWFDDRMRPTRRAKIMFVMRHRSARDAKLAVAQVEALATLVQDVMGNLQSVKHGKAPTTAIMRAWVQAAEGALSQLLLHR